MSGRKSNLKKYSVITNGSMTGTATVTSAITNVEFLDNACYQIDFTGSPTGTFQVQVSANHNEDYQGNVITAGTWVAIPTSYLVAGTPTTAATIPTSVGTPIYVDLNQIAASYIRLVYTNASGSGTLNAVVCGKML